MHKEKPQGNVDKAWNAKILINPKDRKKLNSLFGMNDVSCQVLVKAF